MPESHPYRVAIIGAGPSGTILAKLLLNAGLKPTIFEASPTRRDQGGTLDLHTDTGLKAIKRAGLYDEFESHARYDGESMRLTDTQMRHLLDMKGSTKKSSHGRPEIDRSRLLQVLTDSLPEGTVRWGCKVREADPSTGMLTFASVDEGGSATPPPPQGPFDLVVGADGAWSRVRAALSSTVPHYSQVSGYACEVPDAAATAPDLHALVRRGSVFIVGPACSVAFQQLGSGGITLSAWFAGAEQPLGRTQGQIDDFIAGQFAQWDKRLAEPFALPNRTPWIRRALYMLPVGFRWAHRPGATLVGDAAHLMTPFLGEGVNAALTDAMELGGAVIGAAAKTVEERSDPAATLDAAIVAFEKGLWARNKEIQRRTWKATRLWHFVPGAPWSTIEPTILNSLSDEVPWLMWPLAVAVTYSWFFFAKIKRGIPLGYGTWQQVTKFEKE